MYVNLGGKYTGLQDFDFQYFFLQTNEKRVQELCNQWRGLLAIKRLPQLYSLTRFISIFYRQVYNTCNYSTY